MLKRKLLAKAISNPTPSSSSNVIPYTDSDGRGQEKVLGISNVVSPFFALPFWEQFYQMECQLNEALKHLSPPPEITHVYNPLIYAAEVHCDYMKMFLNGTKKLIMIGMNPGADGMAQNGVPFGNITTVRDTMQLRGLVSSPPKIHPKRPIKGLQCTTEEPSGKRLWTLLQKLSNDSLQTFSQQCFVHNFCPLAFFDSHGRNITPNELKGPYKNELRDICLETAEKQLYLVQPEVIIGVGDYVFRALQKSQYCKDKRLLRLAHPSPRSLNNTDWPAKAEIFFRENDLLKYLRNECMEA